MTQMLFAVDVGNSNLTLGVHRDGEWVADWRLKTDTSQSADGWGVLFRNLFSLANLSIREVNGIIIASVVPSLDSSLEEMARRYFNRQPLFVNHEIDTGMVVNTDHPAEVGADRIVNSVAAYAKLGGPCIAVDFGTAITFDCVSAAGEYIGGAICPGIAVSSEALFRGTARLPQIDVREPETVIGANTVTMLQSGLYYGTLGMVDSILERMLKVLGEGTKVIATGGQAKVICPASRYIQAIEENLTLDGLRLIWKRHSAKR